MSRPSTFTQEAADAICERLAEGRSLRAICREDEDLPSIGTVMRWLADSESFQQQYARAREDQADKYAEEIVEIADEECTMVRSAKHPGAKADENDEIEVVFDSTAVARNRLRVDARKWVASKLKPKKYGERVEVDNKHSGSVGFSLVIHDKPRDDDS